MNRKYTPRRASKRWLGGAPAGVLCCFDTKENGERFTIFYGASEAFHRDDIGNWGEGPDQYDNTWLIYFGCCETPSHPQGVGMHGEMEAYQVAAYRAKHKHQMIRWLDLPEAVRTCVENCLKD